MSKKGGISHDRIRNDYMRQWLKKNPNAKDVRKARREMEFLHLEWLLTRPQPPLRPAYWRDTKHD